jgi:hypothetical protein
VALQLPYRERYLVPVALKFLLKNSPVDLGVPMERGRLTTVTRT